MKWHRWFKSPLIIAGIIVLLTVGAFLGAFVFWKKERIAQLIRGSEIVDTTRGEVEVARAGNGPVILVIHGAPGGYDQGLALGHFLTDAGFEIVTPSRPGYLRTPLSSGLVPNQQADLFAALLEKWKIPKVAVLAFGEGAASAVALAEAYPDRVSKLVLLSPVLRTRNWHDIFPEANLPGWRINEALTGDMGAWLFDQTTRWNPAKALEKAYGITTTLKPFYQFSNAQDAIKIPGQSDTFREFARSLTPVSSREVGIRNDMVQSLQLPPLNFAALTLPVLVVRGEVDQLTTLTDSEKLLAETPDSRILKVTQSGYLVSIGPESDAALKQVVEFLKANP